MHYHISDAVLIELCRIEIISHEGRDTQGPVLIELCRIEISQGRAYTVDIRRLN